MIFQFIDLSAKIFYDDMKAQEEYMNITTSTISHEMRNPLNAIMSQCYILEHNVKDLENFIRKVSHKLSSEELQELKRIKEQLAQSCSVMKTSSQMLMFNVEGVLGIAQIRAQTF